MELMAFSGRLSRQWKRRSSAGYNRLSPNNRRYLKVARLGADKRSWRLRLAPKLRLMRLASPVKLLYKLKSAYTNVMLKLAGSSNTTNVFGTKRIAKAPNAKMEYSRNEFENRLVFEIYKSISASLELGYNKQYS